MTARSKAEIKAYFQTGDKPTQAQFEDLVDSYQDFGSEVLNYELDTGTANSYVITPSPAITSYTAGLAYAVKIANTNTGASTLNVNGLGAQSILYVDGSPLDANAMPNGAVVLLVYDGSNFYLVNIAPTTSTAGISALTGDVAASGSGSVTATIQTNAVTTTKIADDNVTYAKLKSTDLASASDVLAGTANKIATAAAVSSNIGWVLLSTQTASSSAQIDFTSVITSTYDTYMFVLQDIIPGTDAVSLYLRTSTDNGVSYDAGASDYTTAGYTNHDGTASVTALNSSGSSFVLLGNALGNASGESYSGTVLLHNPTGSATHRIGRYEAEYVTATPNLQIYTGSFRRATNADITAVRFLMSSGNIASGTFRLYGLKK